MKTTTSSILAFSCLVLFLVFSLAGAGCTSMPVSEKSTPVATTVPEPSSAAPPVSAAPVQQAAAVPATTSVNLTTTVFTNATYGLSIAYPADWQKEELSDVGLRDYGRTTLNIANLYSPDISPERAVRDGPNPDKSTYTTLSIDVDQSPVTDFEQYFNLVTLALQNSYGAITITKHDNRIEVSKNEANPKGYTAYQLDFDTKTMRAKYIFVNVDKTIYIISFRNPSPYSSEVDEMVKSIVITPLSVSAKHR